MIRLDTDEDEEAIVSSTVQQIKQLEGDRVEDHIDVKNFMAIPEELDATMEEPEYPSGARQQHFHLFDSGHQSQYHSHILGSNAFKIDLSKVQHDSNEPGPGGITGDFRRRPSSPQ